MKTDYDTINQHNTHQLVFSLFYVETYDKDN